MLVAYEENPVYTYEYTGQYMVKLVSKKVSEFHTCVDTFYLEDYIIVDSSFVAVPNVFTPNGDGINEIFEITDLDKYISNELKVFSRYGKRVYSQNNYQGDWDGGGLSQGVYFYVLTLESYFGTEVKQGSLTIFR